MDKETIKLAVNKKFTGFQDAVVAHLDKLRDEKIVAATLSKPETVTEDFDIKSGRLKLKKGGSITVSDKDAKCLDEFFNGMKPEQVKKFKDVLISDKEGFDEILTFARAQK